jgi:hypothetical protein
LPRDALEDLVRDRPLTTLALGVAAAFALLDVGRGVDSLVEGLATHQQGQAGIPFGFVSPSQGGLSWTIGHRVLTFDKLLLGLIELAVVAAVALLLSRRGRGTE